jgi:hypothetical protein
MADLLVEGVVLRFGDVGLGTRPQGRGLVHRFPLVLEDMLALVLVPFLLAHQDGQ